MAGCALVSATLVACALLLLLVHLELRASAPLVVYDVAEEVSTPPLPRPAPAPPPIVEPVCQVTFGKAECMRAGAPTACPENVDLVRHDTSTLNTGAWLISPTYTYFLDRGLAGALANLFAGVSVVELGAGKGCYASYLRRAPPARHGESRIGVRAFDGAPNVVNLTGGLVMRADLTRSLVRMPPSEWVLCLETAEHIPRAHEETMLQNMDSLNTVGVVLSWSNNAGGNGHVNLRTNDWVVRRFRQMGYAHDVDAENALRHAVKDIHWFRDTVMVFRRRGGARGARNRRTREQMAPDT